MPTDGISAASGGNGDFGTSPFFWQRSYMESRTQGTREAADRLQKFFRSFGHELRMTASVKGFGCRPLTAVPRTPAAGVRKPPREETAIRSAIAVPRYGDLDRGSARSL